MKKWNFYTSKEIKPKGWMRDQLKLQLSGLSGNLDKVWRDVRDSAWIGGDAESWERVPYWLDGVIPLAYLLEDEDMIGRTKRYIDAIIKAQRPDGWICPCSEAERAEYDTWAVLLITKVLTVYYECSGDTRIPDVIYKTLKNYYDLLKSEKIKLFGWGKHRWYEGFIAINFLSEHFSDEWIRELAEILYVQGADYNEFLPLWERPLNCWKFGTHIVNIVMALKHEAVSADILDKDYTDNAEVLYDKLYKYNGTPVGAFTGDECLSGLSPIQGTELCSVVEQMYSYELLYSYTGDKKWAERLEVLAFNALPASISDDMWSHQYDQMSNQIACIRFPGKPVFRTNTEDAHLFGLEPNYGCCTANFSQGWPKFMLSAFLHSGDTIINAVPVPTSLNCEKAKISLKTEYPFKNEFVYSIEAKEDFTFKVRIPSFAENLVVDGCRRDISEELSFDIKSGESRNITVSFETEAYTKKRPHDLNTVRYGSLVFSLPIKYGKKMYEYEKNGVERKFPYCDYEYIPESKWNYAYSGTELKVIHSKVSSVPFSSEKPPVMISTKVKEIDWGFEDGYDTVCAKTPLSIIAKSDEEDVFLYPYGCAKLRMTELPFVE